MSTIKHIRCSYTSCSLALLFKEAAIIVCVMKMLLLPWLLCGFRDDAQLAQVNKQEEMYDKNNSHAMFM